MNYVISAIIGYLLGSIPTAYLILKKTKDVDISESGSKNVGALNSYEVSNSKIIGVSVLIIDYAKGLIAALIPHLIFGPSFEFSMLSLVFAVLAHCYSPWLNFKGGRGLATAAGGASFIAPVILILWILIWLISFAFRRNVHFSNSVATILTGALAVSSADILNTTGWLTNPPAETNLIFMLLTCAMMLIIISRHIEPMKEYFGNQKNKVRRNVDE
jgi:glycerol-3-phosphate acyltransferase PlsY